MAYSIDFKEPQTIDAEFTRQHFPNRPQISNKGTFGKVLNIAGCKNYAGAAYLSSVSPLKIGAGLVVLASCSTVIKNVSTQTPNVVMSEINKGHSISCDFFNTQLNKINFNEFKAISIGCGLGQEKPTMRFLKRFISKVQNTETPIIYDADALNIITKLNITNLGKNTIITPHPAEMARLMNTTIEEIQSNRLHYTKKAVEKYNATVVLKGNNTIIATPDGDIYADNVGSQILAKAGIGDVLVGIISGLCAQGTPPNIAAPLGVFIHSNSAKYAREKHLELFKEQDEFALNASTPSLLASELIDFIPAGIALSGI